MDEDDIIRWSEHETKLNDKYAEIPVSTKNSTVLKVKIISGFDINRDSILDLVDVPNPQIVVEYPGAVGRKKFKTSSQIDTVTPVWNESFRFVLPDEELDKERRLKFTLMVEDWHSPHFNIGEAFYDPSNIEMEEKIEDIISFGNSGKIKIKITKRKKLYLRLSLSLCDKEMEFRIKRIPKVMRAFQQALKSEELPENLFETPVMSFVTSGGGIRATTAMCGVMEGLDKIGLLDCMMYSIGTSGSSWYLASAYARRAFKGKRRNNYHSWLRTSFETSCFWELLKLSNLKKCRKVHRMKTKVGQPFTLVDYYGICAANKVVGKKFVSTKLSDLQSYVETADVPYPIFNTSQVQDFLDIWKYRADCNLTPYECEIPQYGLNINMKRFNSQYFAGVMERELPEPDLTYIIGTLGSIFGLRLNRIFGLDFYEEMMESITTPNASEIPRNSSKSGEQSYFQVFLKCLSTLPQFLDRNMFIGRTGQILNPAQGFNNMKRYRINPFFQKPEERIDGFLEQDEVLNLVDGGILCNVAVDAALRPQRRNEILFVADFTSYDQDISFETLQSACKLAKEGGYKFPPVDIEKIKNEETKELYIFEDINDPECPVVFWLLTSTLKFRQLRNYTPMDTTVLKNIKEGERFNQFEVMESEAYDTFNLSYSNLDFDRLRELMIYNVTINEEAIKNKIRERIELKRKANFAQAP